MSFQLKYTCATSLVAVSCFLTHLTTFNISPQPMLTCSICETLNTFTFWLLIKILIFQWNKRKEKYTVLLTSLHKCPSLQGYGLEPDKALCQRPPKYKRQKRLHTHPDHHLSSVQNSLLLYTRFTQYHWQPFLILGEIFLPECVASKFFLFLCGAPGHSLASLKYPSFPFLFFFYAMWSISWDNRCN